MNRFFKEKLPMALLWIAAAPFFLCFVWSWYCVVVVIIRFVGALFGQDWVIPFGPDFTMPR